jgi:hypothetical protein
MAGGYAYRKVQTGVDRYTEKPEKNRFSHVVESLEYGILGAGEGYQFIDLPRNRKHYKVARSMRQHRYGPQKAV